MINKYSTQILVNFVALRKTLKNDYSYTESEFLHTMWRLIKARDEVKIAFAKWYNDDICPQLECEGITWNDLVAKRGLNPYNAFLFMDTMLDDPEYGFTLIKGSMNPSLRLNIDQLRPDLRDYVAQELAKEDIDNKAIEPDKNGYINIK